MAKTTAELRRETIERFERLDRGRWNRLRLQSRRWSEKERREEPYSDLSGFDFSGFNVAGFDFTNCSLEGCTFSGSLAGTRFDHADLQDADFSMVTDWAGASFAGAYPLNDVRHMIDPDTDLKSWAAELLAALPSAAIRGTMAYGFCRDCHGLHFHRHDATAPTSCDYCGAEPMKSTRKAPSVEQLLSRVGPRERSHAHAHG